MEDNRSERAAREALRKKRSMVLKLLQELGVDTTDWTQVNDFCRQARIAGKVFRDLTAEDLDKLGTKLRVMKRKGYRRRVPERPTVVVNLLPGIGGAGVN